MDRNIGAPNRRIPPDVQPKGSTARDLERDNYGEIEERTKADDGDLSRCHAPSPATVHDTEV